MHNFRRPEILRKKIARLRVRPQQRRGRGGSVRTWVLLHRYHIFTYAVPRFKCHFNLLHRNREGDPNLHDRFQYGLSIEGHEFLQNFVLHSRYDLESRRPAIIIIHISDLRRAGFVSQGCQEPFDTVRACGDPRYD
jgi:hypothetical protein